MPTYTYTANARPAPLRPPRARGRNAFELPRPTTFAPVKRQGSDISRGSDSASSLDSRSDQTTRSQSPSDRSSTPPTSPASDASSAELRALQYESSPASDSADEDVFEDALSSPLESPSSGAADSDRIKVAPTPEICTAALDTAQIPLPASPVDAGRNACQEPVPDSPMRMLSSVLLGDNTHTYTRSDHSSPAADIPLPPSPINAGRPSRHPQEPAHGPPLPAFSSVSGTTRASTSKRDSYYTRIHARQLPRPPRPLPDPPASSQFSPTLITASPPQHSATAPAPRGGGDAFAETWAREVAVPVAHTASPASAVLLIDPSCTKLTMVQPSDVRITEGTDRQPRPPRACGALRGSIAVGRWRRGRGEQTEVPPARGRSTHPKSLTGSETRRIETRTFDFPDLGGGEPGSQDEVMPETRRTRRLKSTRSSKPRRLKVVDTLELKSQGDGVMRRRAKRTRSFQLLRELVAPCTSICSGQEVVG